MEQRLALQVVAMGAQIFRQWGMEDAAVLGPFFWSLLGYAGKHLYFSTVPIHDVLTHIESAAGCVRSLQDGARAHLSLRQ